MELSKVEKETLNSEGTFDLLHYGDNLNTQLNYISKKINECEKKLTSLKGKEDIINTMINKTNVQIERYSEENNWKLVGINNSQILTQFETLSMVQEMLCKYEDMIQRYIKMSIDIENHKINAYVKIVGTRKEDKKTEEGFESLMHAMHQLTSQPQNNDAMAAHVKEQLKLEGY